jgi:hypothetical protein
VPPAGPHRAANPGTERTTTVTLIPTGRAPAFSRNVALHHQAWRVTLPPCGVGSLPPEVTVQQQARSGSWRSCEAVYVGGRDDRPAGDCCSGWARSMLEGRCRWR